MQIGATANISTAATMSLLKSANQLPELAGELIQKTLDGLSTAPVAETPPAESSPATDGRSPRIDIYA